MLLGTQRNQEITPGTENLVLQLLSQQRYAEAYELLIRQEHPSSASRYNMAICLHWAGNYQAAISQLDKIQRQVNISSQNTIDADRDYRAIRDRQRQTDDHLQGMSELYPEQFSALFQDSVTRLKADCWLQLGDFPQVIAIATPIGHKGYKNIIETLKIANSANDKRI